MEIKNYIDQKKELYDLFLEFLETTSEHFIIFDYFTNFIKEKKYEENQEEFKHLLRLISKISNNHHRHHDFNHKIHNALLYFKDKIKQTLSNIEIFEIFKNNKLTLLFLLEKNILVLDESIIYYMIQLDDLYDFNFCHFFYSEIKPFIDEGKVKMDKFEFDLNFLNNYEEKRHIGENDSYVCSLIRQDLIDDFVSYMTQSNLSNNKTIDPSIYETNSFIIKSKLTLIEYAAFYGSIQIFQYLKMNNADLDPFLWICAIHSNDAQMVHLLEVSGVKMDEETFVSCIDESIKCHHNGVCNYISENLVTKNISKSKLDEVFVTSSIKHYNYAFFPNNLDNNSCFYSLCRYDYFILINLFYEMRMNDYEVQI